MLPTPFEFERPSTIADAVSAVGQEGDGMFYSGGTELLLAMKMRVIHTERLVDIKGIPGLDRIVLNDANELEIGSAVHAQEDRGRSRHSRTRAGAGLALCQRGERPGPQRRNNRRQSVLRRAACGSANDARGAGCAAGASRSERHALVHADDFIRSELETVREPDELLTVIVFPRPTGPVTYRRFKHGERPSVNVGMAWSMEAGAHSIKSARVRVGALGSRPQPLKAVEGVLKGLPVA